MRAPRGMRARKRAKRAERDQPLRRPRPRAHTSRFGNGRTVFLNCGSSDASCIMTKSLMWSCPSGYLPSANALHASCASNLGFDGCGGFGGFASDGVAFSGSGFLRRFRRGSLADASLFGQSLSSLARRTKKFQLPPGSVTACRGSVGPVIFWPGRGRGPGTWPRVLTRTAHPSRNGGSSARSRQNGGLSLMNVSVPSAAMCRAPDGSRPVTMSRCRSRTLDSAGPLVRANTSSIHTHSDVGQGLTMWPQSLLISKGTAQPLRASGTTTPSVVGFAVSSSAPRAISSPWRAMWRL
jgi:hypothetical protein